MVFDLKLPVFEDASILVAENRQQNFLMQVLAWRLPVDIEKARVWGTGSVLEYVGPPPVSGVRNAHVIGNNVHNQTHAMP
jgi:hypothetical protein